VRLVVLFAVALEDEAHGIGVGNIAAKMV